MKLSVSNIAWSPERDETGLPKPRRLFPEELADEGAFPDAGGLSLDNADHLVQPQ